MSFNDYLKYVKGHSVDVGSIQTTLPERLNTAIIRRASRGVNVDIPSLIDISKINIDNYKMKLKIRNPYNKYKITIYFDDPIVNVRTKSRNNVDSSVFSNTEIVTKTLSEYYVDVENILETGNENSEEYKYIHDGIKKIGNDNIVTNIITIVILEVLEIAGFFTFVDNMINNAKSDLMDFIEKNIPEEYRSSEPGPAAHPDDGNTQADESADSKI